MSVWFGYFGGLELTPRLEIARLDGFVADRHGKYRVIHMKST